MIAELRATAVGSHQLALYSALTDMVVPRSGSCSTEYVRGREALRPELSSVSLIANRNSSFILQEVGSP